MELRNDAEEGGALAGVGGAQEHLALEDRAGAGELGGGREGGEQGVVGEEAGAVGPGDAHVGLVIEEAAAQVALEAAHEAEHEHEGHAALGDGEGDDGGEQVEQAGEAAEGEDDGGEDEAGDAEAAEVVDGVGAQDDRCEQAGARGQGRGEQEAAADEGEPEGGEGDDAQPGGRMLGPEVAPGGPPLEAGHRSACRRASTGRMREATRAG